METQEIFSSYQKTSNRLSKLEEDELVLRWQNDRDERAMGELIASNLGYIYSLVKVHVSHGTSIDDLMNAGIYRFFRMIDLRYRVDGGANIRNYGRYTIICAGKDCCADAMGVSREAHESAMRSQAVIAKHKAKTGADPDNNTIAAEADITAHKVTELGDLRNVMWPGRLQAPVRTMDKKGGQLQDSISQNWIWARIPEVDVLVHVHRVRALLENLMETVLSSDEAHVLRSMFLSDAEKTGPEIADDMEKCNSRINQIKQKALKKLRRALENRGFNYDALITA
ncbi:sigma-70 family RNA polymerase sigma factor [Pseudomonadota bacterium]